MSQAQPSHSHTNGAWGSLVRAARGVLASAWVGTVYGFVCGAMFGSIIPVFGTLYGMLWGALSGFFGGTVGCIPGKQRYWLSGVLGGLATVPVSWSLSLFGAGYVARVIFCAIPVAIATIGGVLLWKALTSNDVVFAPLSGWLNRVFHRSEFESIPVQSRIVAAVLVLGSAVTVEWARQHFDIVLW